MDHFCYCIFLIPVFFLNLATGRRRLNADAVPSIFPFKKPLSESQRARKVRAECRLNKKEVKRLIKEEKAADKVEKARKKEEESTPGIVHEQERFLGKLDNCLLVGAHEVVESEITAGGTEEVPAQETKASAAPPEGGFPKSDGPYRIEKYIENDEAIKYLTGFDNYAHFKLLFNVLGPACFELKYKSDELNAENELFLTLMKLRHAKDDFALSLDFGVGRKVVSKIVRTWVNFMYFELSELDFWCERDVIDEHFPVKFQKMFPKTRVILDATEIPTQKPSNCNSQRITFSTYKNGNTLKTMVGISPRGVVTFISDTYGGSVSDRQIIEKSSLLEPGVFNPGDSIMADRGIMVQDLFAHRNVQVNTPTTMKGRNQLEPGTVIKDRRIACKRIHVERVIGFAKTFRILSHKMKKEQITIGGRFIKVCFLLTNFRNCIVGKRA